MVSLRPIIRPTHWQRALLGFSAAGLLILSAYGTGAPDPEPDPSVVKAELTVDWTTDQGPFSDYTLLDPQVASVLAAGAEPLIWFNINEVPTDLAAYDAYTTAVASHLKAGWPVRLFRFGNEPDSGVFWPGTRQEFYDTYATWARALKAVDPDFVLMAPGLLTTDGGPLSPDINGWVTGLLDYCQAGNVPLDLFSFHTYSSLPSRYHDETVEQRTTSRTRTLPGR